MTCGGMKHMDALGQIFDVQCFTAEQSHRYQTKTRH